MRVNIFEKKEIVQKLSERIRDLHNYQRNEQFSASMNNEEPAILKMEVGNVVKKL